MRAILTYRGYRAFILVSAAHFSSCIPASLCARRASLNTHYPCRQSLGNKSILKALPAFGVALDCTDPLAVAATFAVAT